VKLLAIAAERHRSGGAANISPYNRLESVDYGKVTPAVTSNFV
jgi:hypothetical protein